MEKQKIEVTKFSFNGTKCTGIYFKIAGYLFIAVKAGTDPDSDVPSEEPERIWVLRSFNELGIPKIAFEMPVDSSLQLVAMTAIYNLRDVVRNHSKKLKCIEDEITEKLGI